MEIKPIPSGQKSRQDRRVRLTTRVESRATGITSVGLVDNISVGGLLVIAHDTFESGTEVVVLLLPPVALHRNKIGCMLPL